jgi:transposase InsO family protein
MTSKTVAALRSELEVTKSHSRPRVSNDNPYSEACFKTSKFPPVFPENFGTMGDAPQLMDTFVEGRNHSQRHTGIGLNTPPMSTTDSPPPKPANGLARSPQHAGRSPRPKPGTL